MRKKIFIAAIVLGLANAAAPARAASASSRPGTALAYPAMAGKIAVASKTLPVLSDFPVAAMPLASTGRVSAFIPNGNPFALTTSANGGVLLAHAILVKALPERESTIIDVPEEILLTFNEGVGAEFLALAVIDPAGQRVDNHDAKLDFTDHSHLRASIAKLTPGRYTVRYRVLSADGHVVSGKYFFQVQAK